MPIKTKIDIADLVRENIRQLTPYSSARSEFKGRAEVLLDANESPFETGMNRYPDPLATRVRERLGELKGIDPSRIVLGNGSDELVDYVTRIFCRPGVDNVICMPPTFGMYIVAADINDVECRKILLTPDFTLPVAEIEAAIDENSRVLWICSPNNPSGNLMPKEQVEYLLDIFPGIVVIDEAYIEYLPEESFIPRLDEFPNLIVTQTLSKAWGLAGIRLGAAYASAYIISLMQAVKMPYNVNVLTQQRAMEALSDEAGMKSRIDFLVQARKQMAKDLAELDFVQKVFPSVTNYLLVKFNDARMIYDYLLSKGIVVRDRSSQPNCENCLRITIGTQEENRLLLDALVGFRES
ncbi:MAG: histidinol-phosphate transaminase [Bacteroidota bacterium]